MLRNALSFNTNAFQVRNYASLASLVFMTLEYFSNFHSEYRYVWRARSTAIKYIYLTSRYVGLIGQIVNYILVQLLLSHSPVELGQCRIWFLFLFAVAATSVASLDSILLLRVYALYKKDVKVYVLTLPLVLQFVVASIVMERVTRSLFGPHCDRVSTSMEIGLMGGSVALSHTAVWMATFAKRNVADGRAAVVQLVVCEGAWIILVIVGIIVTSVTSVVIYSANPFVLFVWPSALVSAITCRIILNMNMLRTELPRHQGEENSSALRLSTIVFSSPG